MELSQRTEQRQELHLTAELRQGIAVLQMSSAELAEYVQQAVESNPFLDDSNWNYPKHSQTYGEYAPKVSMDELLDGGCGYRQLARSENASSSFDASDYAAEEYFQRGELLSEHLVAQLPFQTNSKKLLRIGDFIIGCLDRNGYLKTPLKEIAACMNESIDEVQKALDVVQRLDPAGVGARDVVECLRLQLTRMDLIEERGVRQLLGVATDSLGSLGAAAIAKKAGLTMDEFSCAMDTLRKCDPFPGAQFGENVAYVWPEVIVEPAPGGGSMSKFRTSSFPMWS